MCFCIDRIKKVLTCQYTWCWISQKMCSGSAPKMHCHKVEPYQYFRLQLQLPVIQLLKAHKYTPSWWNSFCPWKSLCAVLSSVWGPMAHKLSRSSLENLHAKITWCSNLVTITKENQGLGEWRPLSPFLLHASKIVANVQPLTRLSSVPIYYMCQECFHCMQHTYP